MKDVSDQQVTQHLQRLNPWWKDAKIDAQTEKLIPRAYLEPIDALLQDLALRRAIVLLGSRRVGKTVLIRHLIGKLLKDGVDPQRIAFVEMDHPLLHGRSLDDLIFHIEGMLPGGEGIRYLFFDEIQSHKDWEIYLKAIVDHRPDLRILVSGSAAAALKRQSTESGAGRFTDVLLPPLTFSEYLNLSSKDAGIREIGENSYQITDIARLNGQFIEYVQFGGYPELALSEAVRMDPERFVKSDIVDKVLLRDLPQLYGIKDIQELNSLFTLLAFNTAEEVSLEDISKRSGVGKQTIQKYIEYLEAAFLLKRVFRVDQDGNRYHRERHFKVFLTNSAMYTVLFGITDADDDQFGHLVETALFQQRFHEGAHLNYARWKDCEVDFIESDAAFKPRLALEIKWRDAFAEHPGRLKGLRMFAGNNKLTHVMATTRSKVSSHRVDDVTISQVPSAALAYHYGVRAVRNTRTNLESLLNVEMK